MSWSAGGPLRQVCRCLPDDLLARYVVVCLGVSPAGASAWRSLHRDCRCMPEGSSRGVSLSTWRSPGQVCRCLSRGRCYLTGHSFSSPTGSLSGSVVEKKSIVVEIVYIE